MNPKVKDDRVTRIKLQNFKAIGEPFELELLTSLTVLIGANSSGKSSVLQGVARLGQVVARLSQRPSSADSVARSVFHSNAKAEELVGAGKGPHDEPPVTGRYVSEFIKSFRLSGTAGDRELELVADVDLNRPQAPPELTCRLRSGEGIFNLLDKTTALPTDAFGSQYLRPEFQLLAEPSRASTEAPALEETGRGLAVLLSWLATNKRKDVDSIERLLREIVPSFEELRIRPVAVPEVENVAVRIAESDSTFALPRDVAGHQLDLKFSGVERWVPAHHVSEGTLLALALLTALHAPNRPRLLLIDDLDRGLHPSAQAALATCVRAVVEKSPGVQVIATTHSPYLLDSFKEDEVRVLSKRGLRVVSRRFSEHPDWERFKSTMKLGEFWASVGDAWAMGE